MRNKTIDIMRALTMVLMITVNHFWTATGIPHWMHHAEASEDMLGLSDVVFPLFIFVMGMSIPYAIDHKLERGNSERSVMAHIISRSVALLAMGAFICHSEYGISAELSGYGHVTYSLLMVLGFFLVWNHYPRTFHAGLRRALVTIGFALLAFLALTARNGDGGVFSAHWWGILGLIGWSYLICAMVYFFFRERKWVLASVFAIFLLINLLVSPAGDVKEWHTLLNLPSPNMLNEALGILHLGNCGLAALGMAGVLLTVLVRQFDSSPSMRQYGCLLGVSAACLVAGVVTHQWFIISKIHATAPWVLFSLSIGVALYALITWLVSKGLDGWARFVAPAGTATLTCYLLPYALYTVPVTLPDWVRPAPWGVMECLAFALLCVAMTWLLGKVGIKLKI